MDEYLPPVVTKLKADLSDFVAGITEARALMKAFANDAKADMMEASRAAGSTSGMVMVTEMRKVIKNETDSLGDDIGSMLGDGTGGGVLDASAGRAGKGVAKSFLEGMKSMLMPGLIAVVIAALPTLATAIAGAIQLGMGLGFIGLGAFMLRNEASLIAAATRFRDKIAAVFRTAAAPMLGPLITALDKLGASFERLSPMISRAFAALAPAIEPLAVGIAGMMESMAPGLTNMLIAAGPVIAAFASELPGIGVALGEFFQMIADNSPTIIAFIHDMGRIFPAVLRVVTGFLAILIGIYGWISKLHSIMTKAGFETPFDAMETAGKSVWNWLSSVGPKIGAFFVGVGKSIADWATGAWDKISDAGVKIGEWFSALPGKVWAWLSSLPSTLYNAATAAIGAMLYGWAFGLTKLAMFWVGWVVSLPGLAVGAFNAFIEYVKGNIDKLVAFWEEAPPKIGKFLSDLWTTVSDWFVKTGIMVGEKARDMVTDFLKWWADLPTKVGEALSKLWTKMQEWATTFRNWGKDLGKDIIEGLVKGYLDTLQWAIDKFKAGIDKIKQGAREALDSHSPSREFAKMGADSMRGYVEGFLGENGLIKTAMKVLVEPVGGGAGYSAGQQLASAGTGAASSGGDDRPLLIQLLAPNGEVLLETLIPVAQQKKMRTGLTGLA